jgi:hypothetical protein
MNSKKEFQPNIDPVAKETVIYLCKVVAFSCKMLVKGINFLYIKIRTYKRKEVSIYD